MRADNDGDSAELECICLTRGAEERSFDPSRGRKPRSPHPAQARWTLHTPPHRRVEARTQAKAPVSIVNSVVEWQPVEPQFRQPHSGDDGTLKSVNLP